MHFPNFLANSQSVNSDLSPTPSLPASIRPAVEHVADPTMRTSLKPLFEKFFGQSHPDFFNSPAPSIAKLLGSAGDIGIRTHATEQQEKNYDKLKDTITNVIPDIEDDAEFNTKVAEFYSIINEALGKEEITTGQERRLHAYGLQAVRERQYNQGD